MNEKFVYLFVIVILAICQAMLPFVGRRTQCFGVSIPSAQQNSTKLSANKWAYGISAGLISFIAVSYINSNTITEARFAMIIVFLLIAYYILYLVYHKKIKDIKKTEGWANDINTMSAADLTPPSKGYVSPMWLSLYFGIFVATLALTGILYPRMPEQLAINYDFAGNVTGTTTRTPLSVLFPVIMQFMMACVFVCIYYITLNAKRKLDAEHPKESKEALDVFRNSWAIYGLVVGVLTMGVFTGVVLSYGGIIGGRMIGIYSIALSVIVTVYAIYLSFKVGQGGSKLTRFSSSRIEFNDDDNHWKLGMIYVNKEDPAIFLEKRFGIGWTLNFGNPKAIVVAVAFMVFIFVMVFISTKMQ